MAIIMFIKCFRCAVLYWYRWWFHKRNVLISLEICNKSFNQGLTFYKWKKTIFLLVLGVFWRTTLNGSVLNSIQLVSFTECLLGCCSVTWILLLIDLKMGICKQIQWCTESLFFCLFVCFKFFLRLSYHGFSCLIHNILEYNSKLCWILHSA